MQHAKIRFPYGRQKLSFRSGNGGDEPTRGEGKLDRQAIQLLAVQGLFVTANALSGTFVNVYLWKMSKELALVGWFSLSHQAALGLTFWLAGKWVKERDKMHSLRLGILISAIFYLLVLMLGPDAIRYVYLLGVVQGVAAGLFWLAYNVVYFEITEPDNRDRFNGWAGLLGSGAGMLAPWLSGFLITRMKDETGYTLIFSLSLGIFLIGAMISLLLKKRQVDGRYEWLHGLRRLREADSPWRKLSLAHLMQRVSEGVYMFVIGLLVYNSTGNEMKLGNYSLITSGISLIAFYLVGRWLLPARRYAAMLTGAVLITLVILPFFWKVNYVTLLIFGVGVSLFFPLYNIPSTSTVFDYIGRDEDSAAHRVEYVVLREVALNAGRMAGTLLFISVISISEEPLWLNAFLLVIGSAPIFSWLFMRTVLKQYRDGHGGRRAGEAAPFHHK